MLYDTRSRKAIVLNPTGAWLWNSLSTPQSVSELSQQLQSRFPAVEAAQIQKDVEECLRQLTEQKAVQQQPEA